MECNVLSGTRYMQYLASFIATLTIANDAMYMSWSSPSLPKLTSPESPIGTTLTTEESSWVASIPLFSSVPTFFIVGLIINKLGCKKLLLLASVPLFVPWIVIAFAKSATTIIVLRFIAGIGGATATTAATIYIAEISDTNIRGMLGSACNVFRLMGSLYVQSVGPFLSYKALTLSCSVLPLVFVVTFFFMPESPHYLMKNNKKQLAHKTIAKFSGKNADEKIIMNKMEEIERTLKGDQNNNKTSVLDFFLKKEHRKALILMIGIKTLQHFSGAYAIDSYLITIIKSSKSSISPEITSIICGFVQIPAVLLAAFLIDKVGRKPLLFVSAFGCSAALIGEGVYFYFQDVAQADVSSISWLPTTCLVIFLIMNPLGIFTVPYVILGEIFETNVKGIAVATSTLYGSFLGFLVVKFFEPISEAWGIYTMFWIFAGGTIFLCTLLMLTMPETKGKSFREIQNSLNNTK